MFAHIIKSQTNERDFMVMRFMFITLVVLLLLPAMAAGQNQQASSTDLEFENRDWLMETVGTGETRIYLGREAVFLERAQITLKDSLFSEGVIEFDLAAEQASGFVGLSFRADKEGNGEQFYVRFHQSGHPDSTQYLAKMNGLASWQLHAGPNDATAIELGTGQWIPIRIVVEKDAADIFVRDMNTPLLHIPELRSDKDTGTVTFYAFDRPEMNVGAYFSNLEIRPLAAGEHVNGSPREEAEVAATVIRKWQISSPISESALENQFQFPGIDPQTLGWRTAVVERDGVLNIARYVRKTAEENTVLVRLNIKTDKDTSRLFRFGYSDRVRIYVNGEQQFFGNAQWRSRDHRFLGTIGLHDAVPLHLKAGSNEVIAAVSESFGGWGFIGQIENQTGLIIE
jgi:hypothetical protein